MTTTTADAPHGRYTNTFDRLIVTIGESLIRWATTRSCRRTLSHETYISMRVRETDLTRREIALQRLIALRG